MLQLSHKEAVPNWRVWRALPKGIGAFFAFYRDKTYNSNMKVKPTLNPMVFVKDENNPAFRAYLISRAQEAIDPKNRSKNLSVTEAKELLTKRRRRLALNG